jgi:Kef-type K+ transport system membrane component KefB
MDSTQALIDILLMFAAAKAGGYLFARLRQPEVSGELLAGILIGPFCLGWLHPAPFHDVLAELGIVFLLFSVGLETRFRSLLSVGRTAFLVAACGVSALFLLGTGLMRCLGHPVIEAVFVGTAISATSAGVSARVLKDMGRLATVEGRVILGAAVMDDVLGLILVAVVAAIGRGQASGIEIGLIALETIGFVAVVSVVGSHVARREARHAKRKGDGPLVLALILCLGLAALAGKIGLAAIIGAFLAGMVVAETTDQWDIKARIHPITTLLAPLFFVVMGSRVNPRLFVHSGAGLLLVALTLVAIAGKLVVCGGAAWRLGRRKAAFVGAGMIPRGEVSVIVAGIGAGLGAVSPAAYSSVVGVTLFTTLVTPPLLGWLARKR